MGDNDNYIQVDNDPTCVAMLGRESACLTTVQKDNPIIVSGMIRAFGGKHFREIKSGKSCTLLARARNDGNTQPCVQIGAKIRRLTPTECAHGFKPFLNGIYGMEYPIHSVTRCLGTDGI